MTLSNDAIIFGMAFLNGPKSKISFGGDGAEYSITPRAQAALDELVAAGYAAKCEPSDQIPNRHHFVGVGHLWAIAKERNIDPFSVSNTWVTFSKKEPKP